MAVGLPLSVGGEDLSLVEQVNLALAGYSSAPAIGGFITGGFWWGNSVRWKDVVHIIHGNALLWGNLFVKAGLAGATETFFRLLGGYADFCHLWHI